MAAEQALGYSGHALYASCCVNDKLTWHRFSSLGPVQKQLRILSRNMNI